MQGDHNISMEIADFVTISTRYELAFLGSQSHMGKEVKADYKAGYTAADASGSATLLIPAARLCECM